MYTGFRYSSTLKLQVGGGEESGNFGSNIINLEDGRKCSLCGKSFSDRSSARKHVDNIHFPGSYS